MTSRTITPVILCGGGGTRLWPLSRKSLPKQFLALVGPGTMLQDTLMRVSPEAGFGQPILVCSEQHRFLVAEQARAVGIRPAAILLEPVGRNTAAAIAVAAQAAVAMDAESILLVLPSDHVVKDVASFRHTVAIGAAHAADGRLVAFGMQPTRPETGYGYIEAGEALDERSSRIAQFHEKPEARTAQAYIDAGHYYWNSGMFLFAAQTILSEIEAFTPSVSKAAGAAYAGAVSDLDFTRLASEAFASAPDLSIDVGVMEKTHHGVVVPAEFGWSDVGAWDSLWAIGDKDESGTIRVGDVITERVSGSYVHSEGPLVAAIGVDDLVIVATHDAVLVVPKREAQAVKIVVERLAAARRPQVETGAIVYRPWGSYQSIDIGDRFQVKRIVVAPDHKLSLQMHYHRAEHWIVVSGTAEVTCGDKTFLLHENQSTYIPQGALHRLRNPGKVPLNLIEVQSGTYLGEDDIVRIVDDFGRAPN